MYRFLSPLIVLVPQARKSVDCVACCICPTISVNENQSLIAINIINSNQ